MELNKSARLCVRIFYCLAERYIGPTQIEMSNMPTNLVFVHLGKKLPDHLLLNLERHVSLFPYVETTLITNSIIKKNSVPNSIKLWNYEKSSDSDFLNSNREINFRSGFWRYSLERFFALVHYHEQFPSKRILHIESDILLMPNFPWNKLSQLDSLTWNCYNDSLDVGALVLLPSLNHSQFLRDGILNQLALDPSINDMQALKRISTSKDFKVEYFPYSLDQDDPERNSKLDDFKGVFDGAPVGMWLVGQDPNNNFGKIVYHNSLLNQINQTYMNPVDYQYFMDHEGNLLLKDYSGKVLNLYNLHVHSKNLRIFGPNWRMELDRLVGKSSVSEPFSEFDLRSFLRLLSANFRPIDLCRFVLSHPKTYFLLLYFKGRLPSIYNKLKKMLV